jgi:hypothetical protein
MGPHREKPLWLSVHFTRGAVLAEAQAPIFTTLTTKISTAPIANARRVMLFVATDKMCCGAPSVISQRLQSHGGSVVVGGSDACSAASSPLSRSVASRFTTSSADVACQAAATLSLSAFVVAVMRETPYVS